jgi:hypothetical protein
LISKKFEKEIVFESSVLAWIRIRIEQKCWILILNKSIRILNPGSNQRKRNSGVGIEIPMPKPKFLRRNQNSDIENKIEIPISKSKFRRNFDKISSEFRFRRK